MTRPALLDALYNAGFVAALTGDHAGARADYDEAMRIYEAIGDRNGRRRTSARLSCSSCTTPASTPGPEPSRRRTWRPSGWPASHFGSRARSAC